MRQLDTDVRPLTKVEWTSSSSDFQLLHRKLCFSFLHASCCFCFSFSPPLIFSVIYALIKPSRVCAGVVNYPIAIQDGTCQDEMEGKLAFFGSLLTLFSEGKCRDSVRISFTVVKTLFSRVLYAWYYSASFFLLFLWRKLSIISVVLLFLSNSHFLIHLNFTSICFNFSFRSHELFAQLHILNVQLLFPKKFLAALFVIVLLSIVLLKMIWKHYNFSKSLDTTILIVTLLPNGLPIQQHVTMDLA